MKTLIIWIFIIGHMFICGAILKSFGFIAAIIFFIGTFVVGSFILDGFGVPRIPTADDAITKLMKEKNSGRK